MTDPYSVALTTNSAALGDGRPRRPGAGTAGLVARCRPPRDRAAGGPQRLRAARPRLLDRRRDGAGGRARHLPGVHPRRLGRHAPPAPAGRRRAQHRAPAAGLRHRHDRGAARRRRQTPACDLASLRRRTRASSRPASTDVRRADGFNWGYDPLHYTRPRAPTRPTPRARAARWSSAGWCRASTAPGSRSSWTSSTTTPPRRARTRSRCSTRSCPATTTGSTPTGGVENSTCCANTATEHAMMEKLMIDSVRHLGARLQGQRLPLRPDGPPLAKQNMLNLRAALDELDARARRRRRPVDLPLRRGLELRRGGRRRPLRAGHAAQPGRHRHRLVHRPAARRRTRWRAVRRGPADPGLRLRAVHRPQRRRGQRHRRGAARPAAAPAGPGQARSGRQPRRLRVPRLQRRDGRRQATSTTTASRPGTPPTRARW